MVDKLEACTWCGHEGVLHCSSDGEVEWVRCVHCGRESPLAYNTAEAIQRWNAGDVRAPKPTPTQDARERVKVLERYFAAVEQMVCVWSGSNNTPSSMDEEAWDDCDPRWEEFCAARLAALGNQEERQ